MSSFGTIRNLVEKLTDPLYVAQVKYDLSLKDQLSGKIEIRQSQIL